MLLLNIQVTVTDRKTQTTAKQSPLDYCGTLCKTGKCGLYT